MNYRYAAMVSFCKTNGYADTRAAEHQRDRIFGES